MENQEIMVSVMVTTYNQELYIGQALEMILNQKVSFPYEIIIGNDCSTDRTGDIIEQFRIRYPKKIRVVTNKKNVGEQRNTNKLLRLCRGKYIAVCEGDDYWINDTKLSNQVAFLEQNPQYIGTAHNVLCVDEKGRKLKRKKIDFPMQKQHIYGKQNALRYEELGQMSSYVYRNIWTNATAREFRLFEQCMANTDVKLNATLGFLGDVFYFENVWSCRRRIFHGEGWTALNVHHNVKDYSYISCLNVKKYVQRRFHQDMDVDAFLSEMSYGAVKSFISKPDKENLKVLRNIYKAKKEKGLKLIWDIMRIWGLEKTFGSSAYTYEKIYDNVRKYGYCSPTTYWVSEDKRCIYVQNPKVACSSIKASIFHISNTISDYEVIHDNLLGRGKFLLRKQNLKEDFSDMFSFSFVRNPFERLVSCYVNKFITDKKNNKDNYFKDYFIRSIQNSKSFEEFVRKIFFIPDIFSDWHFRGQHCFMNDFKMKSQLDYIGKYETLNAEYSAIASKYKLSQLEWYNKSPDYDWRDFYTIKTAVLVFMRYRKDFILYGYRDSFFMLIKYIMMRDRRNKHEIGVMGSRKYLK